MGAAVIVATSTLDNLTTSIEQSLSFGTAEKDRLALKPPCLARQRLEVTNVEKKAKKSEDAHGAK